MIEAIKILESYRKKLKLSFNIQTTSSVGYRGYFLERNNTIYLNSLCDKNQQIATALHELAHAIQSHEKRLCSTGKTEYIQIDFDWFYDNEIEAEWYSLIEHNKLFAGNGIKSTIDSRELFTKTSYYNLLVRGIPVDTRDRRKIYNKNILNRLAKKNFPLVKDQWKRYVERTI